MLSTAFVFGFWMGWEEEAIEYPQEEEQHRQILRQEMAYT